MAYPYWFDYRFVKPVDFVVFQDRDKYVVVDRYGANIFVRRSAKVLEDLIDYIVSHGMRSASVALVGYFKFDEDITIVKNGITLELVGVPPHPVAEYSASRVEIVLESASMLDDNASWSILILRNIVLRTRGILDRASINMPKTLLFLENSVISVSNALTASVPWVTLGSAGPLGVPVVWRNVKVHDNRPSNSPQYVELMRVWYEGFRWSGGSIIVNTSVPGWTRFARIVGNVWAVIEDIDMFLEFIDAGTRYEYFWIVDVPAEFRRVQFLESSYIAKYHISTISGANYVFIDHARLREVGSIMLPKVDPQIPVVLGSAYRRRGIAVLSGDGSTRVFKIGTHNLKPDVDASMLDLVGCFATPRSLDALSGAPIRCYLQDDDADGVYESIYIEFANPPPAGTNNIGITWEVAYVKVPS